MNYYTNYDSILGRLTIVSDGENLTGLYFEGQFDVKDCAKKDELQIFETVRHWLDSYFKGKRVTTDSIPIKFCGTDFRLKVWNELLKIPYGEVTTYGDIAKRIDKKMSARAVGGAVGHNPISIIVPCHRVIGAGGKLTGYSGGIEKKIKLLQIEGIDTNKLILPMDILEGKQTK